MPIAKEETYRIIRFYFASRKRRIMKRGLTLEQAQAHCSNPETSSSTSKRAAVKRQHARGDMWFDGYESEGR